MPCHCSDGTLLYRGYISRYFRLPHVPLRRPSSTSACNGLGGYCCVLARLVSEVDMIVPVRLGELPGLRLGHGDHAVLIRGAHRYCLSSEHKFATLFTGREASTDRDSMRQVRG